MAFSDYFATPASNTTINGINIAENCPAANVNNALRQIAADGKSLSDTVAGISTSTLMPKSGGLTPIAYNWVLLSDGGGGSFSLQNSTLATCTVRVLGMAIPDNTFATVRCTATDSLGVTATSNVATIGFVTLRSSGGSGGGSESGI